MKHLTRFAAIGALALISAITTAAQTTRPAKQYTIEQFLTTTSMSGASFSPDESRILFHRTKAGSGTRTPSL
jgi:hypothetical protein